MKKIKKFLSLALVFSILSVGIGIVNPTEAKAASGTPYAVSSYIGSGNMYIKDNYGTWYTIYGIGYSSSNLSYGSNSNSVKALQVGLNGADIWNSTAGGWSAVAPAGGIPITGYFGTQTQAAVKRLQGGYGISKDGICGPNTWYALNKAINHIK